MGALTVKYEATRISGALVYRVLVGKLDMEVGYLGQNLLGKYGFKGNDTLFMINASELRSIADKLDELNNVVREVHNVRA
jgi:hypothetical protein